MKSEWPVNQTDAPNGTFYSLLPYLPNESFFGTIEQPIDL
jgi:hypothetical protein